MRIKTGQYVVYKAGGYVNRHAKVLKVVRENGVLEIATLVGSTEWLALSQVIALDTPPRSRNET